MKVLSERLGDENAGVVDKRIDAPKSTHRFCDDTLGRIPLANVAAYCDDAILSGTLYRSGRGDHVVTSIAVCLDESRANALRRTRDNGNLLHRAHRKSPVTWSSAVRHRSRARLSFFARLNCIFGSAATGPPRRGLLSYAAPVRGATGRSMHHTGK
jgi:hypothetical protein